jgi:hypothetical protein
MPKKVLRDRRVRIGVVGVDSGQILICDPCNIGVKELDYDTLLRNRAVAPNEHFIQINNDYGFPIIGVVSDFGIGDYAYEVWATIGPLGEHGERVKKIEIILPKE